MKRKTGAHHYGGHSSSSQRRRYHSHANPYRTPASRPTRNRVARIPSISSNGSATTSSHGLASAAMGLGSGIAGSWIGAAIGGVGGPVGAGVGAYTGLALGAAYGSGFLTQKKKMARHAVVNAQAGRASMKTTGRKKIKSIRGKKRPIKVSKKLRQKVNKVIEAKKCFGQYITTKQGFVGCYLTTVAPGSNNANVNQAGAGFYSANIGIIRMGTAGMTGTPRFWWHSIPADGQVPVGGDAMDYFHPAKIVDAMSILWNEKPIAFDWTIVAGNFCVPAVVASGAPDVGSAPSPNFQGLKVHVVNAFVEYTVKNVSQRCMKITFYHCVPKIKFPNQTPLGAFYSGAIQQGSTTATGGRVLRALGTGLPLPDPYMNDPSVEPSMVPAFNEMYKYEKHVMLMQPGETCKHSIQGPRNMDLDFTKVAMADVNYGGYLWKKTSCSVMISVEPDVLYGTIGATVVPLAARYVPLVATTSLPVSIETREVYKLRMPENVGFRTAAGAAGTIQQRNLARNVTAWANFSVSSKGDVQAYAAQNEENPAANIAGGTVLA